MEDLLKSTDIEALRELAIAVWDRAETLKKEKAAVLQEKAAVLQEKAVAEAKVFSIERENAVLLVRIAELTKQLAKASQRDVQLALELELTVLRRRLKENANDTYGTKSERRGRKDKKKKEKKAKTGHGPTEQPDLQVETEIFTLSKDCGCGKCGADLRLFGESFETSTQVASIRRSYVMKEIKRTKYACKCCGEIVTAPGPQKLIPGGRYDLSFTVQVALDKYLDSLPLERQVRRMSRVGLKVTSTTLWDQLFALYILLLPNLLELKKRVLASPLVHADETPWKMLAKGRSKKWWMWVLASTAGVSFELHSSRSSIVGRKVFDGYNGIVVADGYAVYASLEKALENDGAYFDFKKGGLKQPNFSLAGCWMHARRPLFKAEKNAPEVSTALDLIAELYAVEACATKLAAGDSAALLVHRSRLRNERSRKIIAQLELWREAQRPLPKTQYAKGVSYLKTYWPTLIRFLDEPLIPLDNGEAERQIRTPVIGRKNYYGVRSERGGRVASLFFSLIQTCIQQGVDPFDYLMEATCRGLANRGSVYLPTDHKTEA